MIWLNSEKMAALAPMPSPSDKIATIVTNGVLNKVRSASFRLNIRYSTRIPEAELVRDPRRGRRGWSIIHPMVRLGRITFTLIGAGLAAAALLQAMPGQAPAASSRFPPALDPQAWQDQEAMTWADYKPIPGTNWGDRSRAPGRALKVALIAIDFEDQPFVITLPKHSDPFGNPQVDPVPRADVAKFYADFWGVPGPLNRGHTINGYWMEQSRGKIGIPKVDVYGPYRMPRKLFEYGLNEYNQQSGCPTGFTCDGRMERDADALWRAEAGADVDGKYEIKLRIYAGYDETTVWQEFGEMKFASRDDIPEIWGNPDKTLPRWVTTRYTPWTTWRAGAQQWGLSSVRQGESSGTITHELGHLVFSVGDNNNNPYVTPYRRVGTGPWDMMDRGSFNGPGGPHRRWVVPAAEGASMPAGLMLRNRLVMDMLSRDKVIEVNRDALAASGPVVVTLTARAVEPPAGTWAGLIARLDGAAPQDRTAACDRNTDPLCAGDPVFNSYSLEVVQRIGYDSFTPDSGVLLAKNKDRQTNSCGYRLPRLGDRRASGRHHDARFPEAGRRARDAHDCRLPAVERRAVSRRAGFGQPVRVERRREPVAVLCDRSVDGRERRPVLRGRRALAGRRRAAGARRDARCAGDRRCERVGTGVFPDRDEHGCGGSHRAGRAHARAGRGVRP